MLQQQQKQQQPQPIRLHSATNSDSVSLSQLCLRSASVSLCGHYIIQLISLTFFQATLRCRLGIIRCSELALLGRLRSDVSPKYILSVPV